MNIDGSNGEGGGQMLRTSLAISAITGEPLRMGKIRANRPKSGLARQHMKAVELLAAMTGAEVDGVAEGSRAISFTPHGLPGGDYRLDVGTAGSITLILQAAIPAALFAASPTKILLTGGTDVKWSPTIDYLKHVFLPACGLEPHVELKVLRRGYYPRGGGEVEATISPCKSKGPILLEPGSETTSVQGIIYSSNLPSHVPRRIEEAAMSALGMPVDIVHENSDALSPGCGITLWARRGRGGILGAVSIGERGVRSEEVGGGCAKMLKEEMSSGASADVHLGDQLLLPLALWGGSFSCRELSLHAKTNIDVIESFLGTRFTVSGSGSLTGVEVKRPYI